MRTIIALLLWCLLLATCWPLALVLIFLLPLLWLLLLPFRVAGLAIEMIFKFITAILLLPLRILGIR